MEQKFLSHHGVMGMKWGVRRQQTNGGVAKSNKTARIESKIKKLTDRAKTWENGKPIKDGSGKVLLNKQDIKNVHDQIMKNVGKQQVKLIKSQYADEYMAGKSAVGRIISKITDSHNIYGETMYNLNHK